MNVRVTAVEIIEYLREIERKSREQPDEDDNDGYATTKQISEELGISIEKTREILRDLDREGRLESNRIVVKVLGGKNRVLAYRLKIEDEYDKN